MQVSKTEKVLLVFLKSARLKPLVLRSLLARITPKTIGATLFKFKVMQKSKHAPREIYENMIGGRVSDAKWSRLQRACTLADIPLDYQSIRMLVELSKLSSHLVNNLLTLKINKQEPCPVDGLTSGETILRQIKGMGIKPNRSTVYRWFYRLKVEFKNTNMYDSSITALVLLQALIYKHKNRSIGYGQNRV